MLLTNPLSEVQKAGHERKQHPIHKSNNELAKIELFKLRKLAEGVIILYGLFDVYLLSFPLYCVRTLLQVGIELVEQQSQLSCAGAFIVHQSSAKSHCSQSGSFSHS